MRFEPQSYFLEAIGRHGLEGAQLEGIADPASPLGKVSFIVPEEHSRILFFARTLLEVLDPESELLALPTEWGIWSSSENWHLYNLVRRASGDTAALKEKPCHCFGRSDRELSLDYVLLFLLFSWDFYLFAHRHDDLLFVSHDGYASYFSPNRVDVISARIEAAEFGFLADQRPSNLQ